MEGNKTTLAEFYQHLTEKNQLFQHQFRLSIDGVEGIDMNAHPINFYATSSTIPAIAIGQADVHLYGTPFRVSGIVKYEGSWSLNCRCDSKLGLHSAMVKWLNKHSSLDKNGGGLDLGKIPAASAKVDILDHEFKAEAINSITLYGIFPVSVGEISLDHSASDALATFTLGITYQYWGYGNIDPISVPSTPDATGAVG